MCRKIDLSGWVLVRFQWFLEVLLPIRLLVGSGVFENNFFQAIFQCVKLKAFARWERAYPVKAAGTAIEVIKKLQVVIPLKSTA
ncbi:MAG: hypothetical protein ACE15E_02800 [Acidobacteriota bacterium]